MPTPKLLVCNRQGTPLGELSKAVLKEASWVLNEPGSLSFAMSQGDPRVTLPKLAENEVQLYIDDVLSHWVVPWRAKGNHNQVEFGCEGLLSYFRRRFITNASQLFTSVDQFSIAFGLITYAQSGADQNLFITNASVTASGVTRSRNYLREEHAAIYDLLQEFPNLASETTGLKNGFDFEIDITGGQRSFKPYHPRKGTLRSTLVLEYGRNISEYEVDEDAVDLANKTYCTGGSNGEIKFEENFRDDASATKHGEMQAIISKGDEKDVTVLKQTAADHVLKHKNPIVNPSLSAVSVPINLLGVIQPGDTVPVRIVKGRHNISGNYRVGSVTWKVKPNKLELNFIEAV